MLGLAVAAGVFVFFLIAGRVISRAGGGPVDDAASNRRALVYYGLVLVVAISLPVLIYDDFKFPR